MRIVFITWSDACGCAAGWQEDVTLQEFNGNAYACGVVLDENEDWIMVASAVTADMKQSQGAVAIPKAMVVKLTELETP